MAHGRAPYRIQRWRAFIPRPMPPTWPEGSNVPANWRWHAQQHGREPVVTLRIEGLPDLLCTAPPADARDQPHALELGASGDFLATDAVIGNVLATGDVSVVCVVRVDFSGTDHLALWAYHDASSQGFLLRLRRDSATQYVPELFVGSGAFAATTLNLYRAAPTWFAVGVSFGGDTGSSARVVALELDETTGYPSAEYEVTVIGTSTPRATRAAWSFTASQYLGRAQFGASDWRLAGGAFARAAVFSRALQPRHLRLVALHRVTRRDPAWSDLVAQWEFQEGAGIRVRDETDDVRHLTYVQVGQPASWITQTAFPRRVRAALRVPDRVSQGVDARAQRAVIGTTTVEVLETADDPWLTAWLAQVGGDLSRRLARLALGWRGVSENEYELLLAGTVIDATPRADAPSWHLRLGDAASLARRSLVLGQATLTAAIDAVVTTIDVSTIVGFRGVTFGGGAIGGYVRIDDEIIRYDNVNTGGGAIQLTNCTRGAYGTTAASHASDATVREVFSVHNKHPIRLALWLLMSAAGDDVDRSGYDTLVVYTSDAEAYAGRGAGLSPHEIDVDQWVSEATARWDYAGTSHNSTLVLDDDVDDVKRWIEEQLLQPLGAWLYAGRDGRLRLGTWSSKTVPADAPKFDSDNIVDVVASSESREVANHLTIRFERDVLDAGKWYEVRAYVDVTSAATYGDNAPVNADLVFWRTEHPEGGTPTFTPDTVMDGWKTWLFGRFADPPRYLTLRVGLEWLDRVQLDDVVLIWHDRVADLAAGRRGVSGVSARVVGRAIDLLAGALELRLRLD